MSTILHLLLFEQTGNSRCLPNPDPPPLATRLLFYDACSRQGRGGFFLDVALFFRLLLGRALLAPTVEH
jgi:hypothetical protein